MNNTHTTPSTPSSFDLGHSIGEGAFDDGYTMEQLLLNMGAWFRDCAQYWTTLSLSPSAFKRGAIQGFNEAKESEKFWDYLRS